MFMFRDRFIGSCHPLGIFQHIALYRFPPSLDQVLSLYQYRSKTQLTGPHFGYGSNSLYSSAARKIFCSDFLPPHETRTNMNVLVDRQLPSYHVGFSFPTGLR
ncbi:hypothetical protein SADUNF_Sadunf15G0121300 [Salix dunnii]|uniref:Uncharacterized protein n=1 Tax=Salix dunnii TaxID=1413687 RepID=A0A835JDV7_9ROSI|nr:hypothetical protein SADUNF_Sadunf15G0121300 [Salix dunnii]